jgi:hypothetical protein
LVSQDYYDQAKVSRDAALAIAELVYEQTYATPLHIADINDQAVATAILSLGVSAWVKRPAQVIQEACVQLGKHISVDAEWWRRSRGRKEGGSKEPPSNQARLLTIAAVAAIATVAGGFVSVLRASQPVRTLGGRSLSPVLRPSQPFGTLL